MSFTYEELFPLNSDRVRGYFCFGCTHYNGGETYKFLPEDTQLIPCMVPAHRAFIRLHKTDLPPIAWFAAFPEFMPDPLPNRRMERSTRIESLLIERDEKEATIRELKGRIAELEAYNASGKQQYDADQELIESLFSQIEALKKENTELLTNKTPSTSGVSLVDALAVHYARPASDATAQKSLAALVSTHKAWTKRPKYHLPAPQRKVTASVPAEQIFKTEPLDLGPDYGKAFFEMLGF